MAPRSPKHVTPAGFWNRPDVVEALAKRDIGAALKIYQRWTGATQTAMSTMTGVPQSHISDILRGKRQVASLDLFERFASGLDIPRALLGLAEPATATPAATVGAQSGTDRRAILAGTAGAVAGAMATADPLAASVAHSVAFLDRYGSARLDPLMVEQFADDTRRIAVEYMAAPPEAMLSEAAILRARVFSTIDRPGRPDQLRDLHLIAGQLSGILAYAAMDLDQTSAAMTNARAALLCADLAGHRDLAVWARGTQSLIARFAGRYTEAARFITAGMDLRPTGTGLARLASGQAQCAAHGGNVTATRKALTTAKLASDQAETDDEFAVGLFGFPRSKVHFYAASSLIWLPDTDSATTADTEAATAIELFQTGPADERFVTDELLGHVYQATARVHLGDIDAATASLQPVLTIPARHRVSWHRRSLARISGMLATGQHRTTPTAHRLRDKITAF